MSDLDLDELRSELDDFAQPEKKAGRSPREERIIAGFEEIQRFVDGHDHVPQHGEERDIFERLYAVRLDRLRALEECRSLLAPLDHQGLLAGAETVAAVPEEEMDEDELLAELEGAAGASDITELRHVRASAEKRAAEEIANREPCPDFERFKPLFAQVQGDLDSGVRTTRPFVKDAGFLKADITEGQFFVLGGQTAYVAEVGETIKAPNGEFDARLRVIYSNGTESNLLRRSLQRALYKDEAGRRITEPAAGPLFAGESDDNDLASGTIYVLRSKSDHPLVAATRLTIENFRSIKALDLDLNETTVLIGPNNAGKTAILDAIRIVLTRRWGQRGTGFTEYDVHLADEHSDPKAPPGVSIEIRVEEQQAGEWPDALQQDLDEIAQTDPATGKTFIILRASCAWSEAEGSFEPSWVFLNAGHAPLIGGSARRMNLERFWQYLPVFYLGALRDVDDEFSPRSQFWGRLLKAMEIPSALENKVQRVLDLLNRKLLQADPRLAQIAGTLSGATRVAARDRDGSVDLRLVPLKSWDLLSKAEIILRNEPDWPWLPLQRHGQGVQSLSVIFLFQAFVEHLLAELYEADSAPVLALEEPETHLHPQAARTLWTHINALPGQKIITTHSPYFVQHVPFRDLRLVRLTDNGTEVRSLPPSFAARIPHVAALDAAVAGSGGLIEYDRAAELLTVHGKIEQNPYRNLLTCYGTHADRAVIHGVLRELHDRSLLFVSDEELRSLETCARRIRGEIFFARRWFIVEGQADYLLVHAVARELGYDLDEHGVALIDAKNNGNPATFAVLARALAIPWLAVFDGDGAGHQYCQSIAARDFPAAFVTARCRTHAAGDLEEQMMADGLEAELRNALIQIGVAGAATADQATLLGQLRDNKTAYAAALAAILRGNAALAGRMPQAFRDAIADLRGLT